MYRDSDALIGTFHTSKEEGCRQSKRDRNDGLREVSFVFVLMKGKPRPWLVAIDETCVRLERRGASRGCSISGQFEKITRHSRPMLSSLGIDTVVTISRPVSHPAVCSAVCER